jgi:hypothetical protein
MQELGAEFYGNREFRHVHGPDPAANPASRLQDSNATTPRDESLGSRKSGDARANDDDVETPQADT